MIGHRSRFWENNDLLLLQGPVVKKKPPFSNARALITRKIMRSREAQCNTGEWPYTYSRLVIAILFALVSLLNECDNKTLYRNWKPCMKTLASVEVTHMLVFECSTKTLRNRRNCQISSNLLCIAAVVVRLYGQSSAMEFHMSWSIELRLECG